MEEKHGLQTKCLSNLFLFFSSAKMNIHLWPAVVQAEGSGVCLPRTAGKWEGRETNPPTEPTHPAAALLNTSRLSVPKLFFISVFRWDFLRQISEKAWMSFLKPKTKCYVLYSAECIMWYVHALSSFVAE